MSPNLLVVEDDHDLLEILCRRLSRRGYSVTGTHHPRQALAAVSMNEFGVAVIDCTLPEMDGVSLMERIHRINGELNVILLSGSADEDLEVDALNRGAFRYLRKPCPLVDLEAVVEAASHMPCESPVS